MKAGIHIALVGNPNSGKSSLFNALTGLHQKVGNFPGVTVDKKTGSFTFVVSVLVGLKKSIHVLQLGSTVREIVNMVKVAVIDAQNK